MQNRAVRLLYNYKKFDHELKDLKWLPVFLSDLIKLPLSAMYGQRHQLSCLQLYPKISFGRQHCYVTRCSGNFANIEKAFCKEIFCHKSTIWWNSLCQNSFMWQTHTRALYGNSKTIL